MKPVAALEKVTLPDGGYPEQICDECAGRALFDRLAEAAVVYCEHNRAGAVLPMDEWRWYVTEDIDAEAFKAKTAHELAVKRMLMERRQPLH
jgi:hypothetical protein